MKIKAYKIEGRNLTVQISSDDTTIDVVSTINDTDEIDHWTWFDINGVSYDLNLWIEELEKEKILVISVYSSKGNQTEASEAITRLEKTEILT